ncbi:thymidine phosphorylase [Mariniblastus fucicola]|uniref:thymidine phosphorylase n=1 Tax=Mariniblastus fucicola TaxID=980251 RepID=A0A5B9PCG1_9BACT|nr:thymidine phosphorylase [Mariniblastus fucicola]QEG20833.1 Pyrimidine-nucleoside phosphorylase [Mariniblastus fucicola]
MNVAQIIEAKREGKELDADSIGQLLAGYADGSVPDYQMSAFAMAVFFQSMTKDEIVSLTRAMINSGDTMKWESSKPAVDKHSTGGVGDKISIVLAPMLACCDVEVPMISGRGLGSTGGTLDKLESIQGYRTDLSSDEFRSIVNWCGCSIASASEKLAPADRKLYALRDVTGTVPSIPLIVGSILSKKIAAGVDALVLDVKWGSGAFMKTIDKAQQLAEMLTVVGNELGTKTIAEISDMNQPLGKMIGNSVEIDESVEVLQGKGPDDVRELTLLLGSRLLVAANVEQDVEAASQRLQTTIDDGSALKKLAEMVEAHGGDLNQPRERADSHPVTSMESGTISRINTDRLGLAVIEMGGGRKKIGDPIDHACGIEFLVRIGDKINKGDVVANVFCDAKLAAVATNLVGASIGI